jgi:hypothetical protein
MSEDNASIRKQKDPAEVWGELDDDTRERVIGMFVDMAFRLVHNQLQSPREGLLPEDGEASRFTFKAN